MYKKGILILMAFTLLACQIKEQKAWIRINNLGYLPESIKVAVLGAKKEISFQPVLRWDDISLPHLTPYSTHVV